MKYFIFPFGENHSTLGVSLKPCKRDAEFEQSKSIFILKSVTIHSYVYRINLNKNKDTKQLISLYIVVLVHYVFGF